MVSNKLFAAALANLSLLASVNAGPCKPQSIATSATGIGSTIVVSDTTTALSTTIETGTAVTETETTTRLTGDGTTTSAPVSETSTTIAVSESTTVASSSDTTIITSSEATTAPTTTEGTTTVAESATTTTEGTTTVAESATTTTTAEAEPTELLINGNFDLGTVSPWLSDNEPIQLGSFSPYEGPAYAVLQFGISDEGESVNDRVYQKIDKSLLKAGTYRLAARLRVDGASDNMFNDGCNAMAVGCYYGDPSNIVPVQGGSNTVSANAALQQWAPLSVTCSLTQDKLDQYGYLSVSIGFSCANAQGNVDAVTFEEVV